MGPRLKSAWMRHRSRKYLDRRLRHNSRSLRAVEAKLKIFSVVLVSSVVCELFVIVYLNFLGLPDNFESHTQFVRSKRDTVEASESSVEFINPKLRVEFEENEKLNSSRDGVNPWIWPTTYSRVPVNRTYYRSRI